MTKMTDTDSAEDLDISSPGRPRPRGWVRISGRRWLLIGLVAALLVPPAVGAWWWSQQDVVVEHRASTVTKDGTYTAGHSPGDDGAARAVVESLPQILSYDYRDLDRTLKQVDAVASASFSGEFAAVFEASVARRATKQHAVTRTVVRAVGLVEGGESDAIVLAFVDQVLVSSREKDADSPVTVSQNRVLVGLIKDGDDWLVDSVDPF